MIGHPSRLAAETSFCEAWSFSKGDSGTAADAGDWETVHLPHTWLSRGQRLGSWSPIVCERAAMAYARHKDAPI